MPFLGEAVQVDKSLIESNLIVLVAPRGGGKTYLTEDIIRRIRYKQADKVDVYHTSADTIPLWLWSRDSSRRLIVVVEDTELNESSELDQILDILLPNPNIQFILHFQDPRSRIRSHILKSAEKGIYTSSFVQITGNNLLTLITDGNTEIFETGNMEGSESEGSEDEECLQNAELAANDELNAACESTIEVTFQGETWEEVIEIMKEWIAENGPILCNGKSSVPSLKKFTNKQKHNLLDKIDSRIPSLMGTEYVKVKPIVSSKPLPCETEPLNSTDRLPEQEDFLTQWMQIVNLEGRPVSAKLATPASDQLASGIQAPWWI